MIDRSRPDTQSDSSDRRRESRRQHDRRTTDRRRDVRFPASARLRFLRSGAARESVLLGELLDVSATGMQLVIDEPLEPAQSLLIEIHDGDRLRLNLTARLIWCQPGSDGRYRAGCELSVELPNEHLAELKTRSSPIQSS